MELNFEEAGFFSFAFFTLELCLERFDFSMSSLRCISDRMGFLLLVLFGGLGFGINAGWVGDFDCGGSDSRG